MNLPNKDEMCVCGHTYAKHIDVFTYEGVKSYAKKWTCDGKRCSCHFFIPSTGDTQLDARVYAEAARKRFVHVTLYSTGSNFIDPLWLARFVQECPRIREEGLTDIKLQVETDKGYYDSVETTISIVGTRLETDEEYKLRTENDRQYKYRQEKAEYEQYLRLRERFAKKDKE